MAITFRTPTVADLSGMLHVEQNCFAPEEQLSQSEFAQLIEHVATTIIIAEVDGQIAGMLIGRTTAEKLLNNASYSQHLDRQPADQYLGILGLAVDPHFQGHGIATQLLARAQQLTHQLGLTGIILDCRQRLIPFYERHGFQLLGHSNSNFGGIEWFGMYADLK